MSDLSVGLTVTLATVWRDGSDKRTLQRFNLKKLNKVAIKNKFADLENSEEIGPWDTIRENIKMSAKESTGYRESKDKNRGLTRNVQNWLIEGSRLKLQWLQDPSDLNEYNLSNVRREASRHFRNKKREYVKYNGKKKNRNLYRGITDFKMDYQPRSNG
jgi:hypothetical protein